MDMLCSCEGSNEDAYSAVLLWEKERTQICIAYELAYHSIALHVYLQRNLHERTSLSTPKERDLKRLMKKVWCGQPFNIQTFSQKLFGLAWQEKCNDENDDTGFVVLVLILPLDFCCKGICANAWIMEPFF